MISPLKKRHLHLKNGMRWDSLVFKNVSRATKKLAFTKQLIKIFLWIVQEGKQGPPTGLSVWLLIRLGLFLFCSPFSAGKSSLVSGLATSACVPFAPLSLLFALFCLKIYPFPPPFLASFPLLQEPVQLTTSPIPSWAPPSPPPRRSCPSSPASGSCVAWQLSIF